jgi:hypothetical protein
VRDNRAVLAAYETLEKGIPKELRSGDSRVGSTHNRRGRGFVRVLYAGHEIKFYPIKVWPSVVGVSVVTLRNWINKRIIAAYEMHGMHVMCKAEMRALKVVVQKWYATRDMHNAIEPEFQRDLRGALAEIRLALDSLKRNLPMTQRMLDILSPLE